MVEEVVVEEVVVVVVVNEENELVSLKKIHIFVNKMSLLTKDT